MSETVEEIVQKVEEGIAEAEAEVSELERAKAEYEALLREPGLEQREVQIEVMEKFTEAQLAEKGHELASVLLEMVAEKEEFDATAGAYKLRKKDHEAHRDKLRDEIEAGQGIVKVNAIETFVPKARKAITRDISGAILKERTLSEDELADRSQMSLEPMSEEEVAENAKAFLSRDEDEDDGEPTTAEDLDESTEEELERARNHVRNGGKVSEV